ncbi:unnamed protein product, partial [marine sediment metagenome]
MSSKWTVDPVRIKQAQIRAELKRLKNERLRRHAIKGFTHAQAKELELESDRKMIHFYRKELLEIHYGNLKPRM